MSDPDWRSRTRSMVCGSAALPRMTSSEIFVPRQAMEQSRAFVHGHVARGPVVDRPDEVTGAESSLGGRRARTDRDDAQVVLTRQLDADISRTDWRVRFVSLGDVRREVAAVGVQAVRQAVHRALHRLLHVDFLDVVVQDERDDVFEHPQVLIRVVPGHRLAEVAADEGECDDGGRDRQDEQARARCHVRFLVGASAHQSVFRDDVDDL